MVVAKSKYLRISPRKLRRVVNVIRGMDVITASDKLKFMPYSAASVVGKILKSAVANAKENNKLNPSELRITKAYVDQATTLKRWRAMSRGRGFPILKRTSHVTIEVNHDENLATQQDIRSRKSFMSEKKLSGKHDHKHDHEHKHEHEHEHGHGQEPEPEPKVQAKQPKTKEVKSKTKDTEKKVTKKKKEKEE